MQITSLSKILKARRMAGHAYLAVFAADTGTAYELFLPSAGYPEFTGFMSPSLRNQSTGESWVMDWSQAELIAAHLDMVLETAGAEKEVASEIIGALRVGKRYGHEV
jgi:hypothetical protein